MSMRSRTTALAERPRPKKRFGQHFLTDPNILSRIVDASDIVAGDTVIEVGPGRGALTEEIASRGANVVAVELDRDLVPFLRVQFEHTRLVTIVEADILNTTPEQLLSAASAASPYAVVANLPYNIAAPTLRKFLESDCQPTRLVVMVQVEVAESIAAAPGFRR